MSDGLVMLIIGSFTSSLFSSPSLGSKGRAKVVGYVLERDKSPNLPRFSELSIGRVGFSLLGPKLCEEIAKKGHFCFYLASILYMYILCTIDV